MLSALLRFLGRLLFVAIFLVAGFNQANNMESAVKKMPDLIPGEFQEPAAYGTIALVMGGSVLVGTGGSVQIGSFMLMLFLVPITYFEHYLPLQENEGDHLMHIVKNVAILGGAIALMGYSRRSSFLAFVGRVLTASYLGFTCWNIYQGSVPVLMKLLAAAVAGAEAIPDEFKDQATLGVAASIVFLTASSFLRGGKLGCLLLAVLLASETYLVEVATLVEGEGVATEAVTLNLMKNVLKNASIVGACLAMCGYAGTSTKAAKSKKIKKGKKSSKPKKAKK